MVQCTHWSQHGAPETAFVRYAAEAPIKCSRCGTEVVEQSTVAALRAALEPLLNHYVDLINSGDCGFWDPEREEEVTTARAALAGTAPAAPGEPHGEPQGEADGRARLS